MSEFPFYDCTTPHIGQSECIKSYTSGQSNPNVGDSSESNPEVGDTQKDTHKYPNGGEVAEKPAAREWWIRLRRKEFGLPILEVTGDRHAFQKSQPGEYWTDEVTHVIERSAYDAVVRERDGLKAQVDSLVENPETEVLQNIIQELREQVARLEAENKRLAEGKYGDDHRYHPLKAEVERLERELAEEKQWVAALQKNELSAQDDIVRLQAENAELRATTVPGRVLLERDAARAEVELLKLEVQPDKQDAFSKAYIKMLVIMLERDRYRAALERIAEFFSDDSVLAARTIARKALEEK